MADTVDTARALEVLQQGTPGPWTIEDPMGPDSLWIVQADKPTHEWFPIAVCSMPDEEEHNFTGEEVKANLRKIAVTPQFVALFAAAVELEAAEAAYREAALGVQPPFGTQEYTEAVVAARARKKAAIAAHKAATAAVTKGVLGHE